MKNKQIIRNAIDAIPIKIKSENDDYFANESHKEKINRKYTLILKAYQFLNEEKYNLAIAFYNSLLSHELFINDYHPYRKLSRVYRKKKLYLDEVNILT